MTRHDDLPYLMHIADSISDIEKSIKKVTKTGFKKNKDIQDATIRRLEVIGEAVKNISTKLKTKYPEVAWSKIAGTRDVMIHAYFSVDLDIVFRIVKEDIPLLKKHVSNIIRELKE